MIYHSKLSDRIGKMLLAKVIEFNLFVDDNGITHEKYPFFFQMPECKGLHISFHNSDWKTPEGIDEILRLANISDWRGAVEIEVPNESAFPEDYNYSDVNVQVTLLDLNVESLLDLYKHRVTPEVKARFDSLLITRDLIHKNFARELAGLDAEEAQLLKEISGN